MVGAPDKNNRARFVAQAFARVYHRHSAEQFARLRIAEILEMVQIALGEMEPENHANVDNAATAQLHGDSPASRTGHNAPSLRLSPDLEREVIARAHKRARPARNRGA